MTSKHLCFRLMKEDLKSRLWAAALIGLGCFFLYPVAAAFRATDLKEALVYDRALLRYANDIKALLRFENGLTVFIMAVASLICGMSSFSYLNSRSKVDFYHSIPVRREKLYLVNFVDGILMLAVPYAISLIFAVLVGVSNGVEAGTLCPVVFRAYCLHMVYFILMYAVVVIAAMMTGNLIVGFMGAMVFWYYIPLLSMVLSSCFSSFFDTYFQPRENIFTYGTRVSPVMQYLYQTSKEVGTHQLVPALGALSAAVLLTFAGVLLYRARSSEAAGKAMAFRVSCPMVRICISMLSGISLGLVFWSASVETTGWLIFGCICGTVISHCVIEIIYHFDFKKLFSHSLQLAGCIIASSAVLLCFRYDVFGYDRYLPQAGQLKTAAVDIDIVNDWVSYGTMEWDEQRGYYWQENDYEWDTMQCRDTEAVLEIARSGVWQLEQSKQKRKEYTAVEMIEEDGSTATFMAGKYEDGTEDETYKEMSSVRVCYTLASGRKVYRMYYMDICEVSEMVDRVYADSSYFETTFPLMGYDAGDIAAVRYNELDSSEILRELSVSECQELLSAYQKELASLTVERMQEEFPVGLLQFSSKNYVDALSWYNNTANREKYPEARWYGDYWKNENFYPLYPSFTETIALLNKYQIEPGAYEQGTEIDFVTLSYYDSEKETHIKAVVTDEGETAQLHRVLKDRARRHYNPFYLADENVNANIRYKNKSSDEEINGLFPFGKTPEFVYEYLKEARDTMPER